MRQTSWYICFHSAGGSTRTSRVSSLSFASSSLAFSGLSAGAMYQFGLGLAPGAGGGASGLCGAPRATSIFSPSSVIRYCCDVLGQGVGLAVLQRPADQRAARRRVGVGVRAPRLRRGRRARPACRSEGPDRAWPAEAGARCVRRWRRRKGRRGRSSWASRSAARTATLGWALASAFASPAWPAGVTSWLLLALAIGLGRRLLVVALRGHGRGGRAGEGQGVDRRGRTVEVRGHVDERLRRADVVAGRESRGTCRRGRTPGSCCRPSSW